MKNSGKLASLFLLVALVSIGGLVLARDIDPAARASERQARAAVERAKAAAEVAEAPARARVMTWGLALAVGAVGVVALAGAAGVVWLVVRASNQARRVEPTASGQFPLVRVKGRGWQAWVDPNRAPSGVTMLGAGPIVSQPLALSEAAHVAIAQQASAVAAVAAASQGGATRAGRASLDVAGMLQPPQSLAAPLPEVTEVDPAHIDRLLALQEPKDEVQDL